MTLQELIDKQKSQTAQTSTAQPSTQGRTLAEVAGRAGVQLQQQEPVQEEKTGGFLSRVQDFGSRLKEKAGETVDTSFKGIKREVERDVEGTQSKAATFARATGRGLGAFSGLFGNVASTIYEELPENFRASVREKGTKLVTDVVEAQKNRIETMRETDPEQAESLERFFSYIGGKLSDQQFQEDVAPIVGTLEAFGVVTGAGWLRNASKETLDSAKDVALTLSRAKKEIPKVQQTTPPPGTTFLSKPTTAPENKLQSATDVLRNETNPTKRREAVKTIIDIQKESTPKVPLLEQPRRKIEELAGVRTDLRERIENNPKEFLNYLDVANQRNLSDKNPTAMAYGAQKVQLAENIISDTISDTGSEIGKFRQQYGGTKATPNNVEQIKTRFTDELAKLNLQLVDGEIVQIPNKVIKVSSPAEIKALKDIKENLEIVYANPTLDNIIEARTVIDKRINFEKSSREISDQLDGLNKGIRGTLADVNKANIPDEQVKILEDYSNLLKALGDVQDFTKRKAGEEYLLRVVLSARGREAGDVIDTIKKYTGIDLMDDATFVKVATELVGNADQKTLLEQNLRAAASLGASLTTGSGVGAARSLFSTVKDKAFDAERAFRSVAERADKN